MLIITNIHFCKVHTKHLFDHVILLKIVLGLADNLDQVEILF